MTSVLPTLSADLTALWPWWLGSILKSTVWLAAAWVVDLACRRRPAGLRHVVAVIAACGVPLIFLLNLSPIPESSGWQLFNPRRKGVDVLSTQTLTARTGQQAKVENGSYIIIGNRDHSQSAEESVPILGDIPFVGRLFRVVEKQRFLSLAAVQVIVSEAED